MLKLIVDEASYELEVGRCNDGSLWVGQCTREGCVVGFEDITEHLAMSHGNGWRAANAWLVDLCIGHVEVGEKLKQKGWG